MSKVMSGKEWRQEAATARASAGRIRQLTDTDIVTRYVPRLAGRNVCLAGKPVSYETRVEAVEVARLIRESLATTTEAR